MLSITISCHPDDHREEGSRLHHSGPSTSTSKAMLNPPLEDRPLVEEREEFFALSREEEKAV